MYHRKHITYSILRRIFPIIDNELSRYVTIFESLILYSMAVIVIHDCALFKLFYLKKSRYDQNQKYNKYNEIIL